LKVDFIINSHPEVTRIGILEDNKLMEIIVEGGNERRQVGNIYLGKINAVLPGMQAAFVDIGLERSAFLHVSDIRSGAVDSEKFARSLAGGSPASTREVHDSIEKVLKKRTGHSCAGHKRAYWNKGCQGDDQDIHCRKVYR